MTRSGRATPRAVAFWLTFVVLALLLAASSRMATQVQRVEFAQQLEIVSETSTLRSAGPEPSQLAGPVILREARIPLPYFRNLGASPGLKRLRLRIDLSRYLSPADGCCSDNGRSPRKSVLVSQALDGMDVYLNGVWIAGLPKSDLTTRYKWYRPLQAPLARRLLTKNGPNILTIEMTSWDPYLQIAPVYVGDSDTITYIDELTQFVGASMANASNVFCLLAGMFMLGAWLASRKDGAIYLHAGATTVLWSVLFSLILLPYVPVRFIELWMWAQYACMGAVIAMLTLFIFAFIDEPLSRIGRALLCCAAAAPALAYPLLGMAARGWVDAYWLPVLLLFHLYACSRLALHVARTRSRAAISLLFQSMLAEVFALRDHNAVMHLITFQMPDAGWTLSHLLATPLFLSHLSVPLLLFVVAHILLSKFQSNVRRVRDHNRILSDSLQQRERELLISYHRQRDMESEAAAQTERDRIYRDLHDGIGSKLVTTLFSVRDRDINHEQLEARLLDALQDIRDIISVTEVHEQRSVQDVLFTYCCNLDEALSRSEFQVEYEIEEGLELVLLKDLTREVMRIVEESVANTIKYAHASRLRIRMRIVEGDILEVFVEDDGQGSTGDPSAPSGDRAVLSGGSGLAGLRQRAARIGAAYVFERTPSGARTQLRLRLVAVMPDDGRAGERAGEPAVEGACGPTSQPAPALPR